MPLAAVVQVPGTYQDALNPQTKLGKAVKAACEEIEHLNKMVITGRSGELPRALRWMCMSTRLLARALAAIMRLCMFAAHPIEYMGARRTTHMFYNHQSTGSNCTAPTAGTGHQLRRAQWPSGNHWLDGCIGGNHG